MPSRPGLVLAVVGRKGAGKTRVIEELVRALRARGLKVCTAKHVPEEDFSLDTPGKDSWRHAEAGAELVALVSPRELCVMRRLRGEETGIRDLLSMAGRCDILLMEGFSSLLGREPGVLKIAVVKSPDEAREMEASSAIRPVLAFVGPGRAEGLKAPYLGFGDLGQLADRIASMLPGRPRASLSLDGRKIPLNPFVQELLRKLVLSFASCLKGVEVSGDEEVEVLIRRKSEEG